MVVLFKYAFILLLSAVALKTLVQRPKIPSGLFNSACVLMEQMEYDIGSLNICQTKVNTKHREPLPIRKLSGFMSYEYNTLNDFKSTTGQIVFIFKSE